MAWRLIFYETVEALFAAGAGECVGACVVQPGATVVVTPAGLVRLPQEMWPRTGTVPRISTTPSIYVNRGREGQAPLYHGYIKDGILMDDVDGRTYPHFPPTDQQCL